MLKTFCLLILVCLQLSVFSQNLNTDKFKNLRPAFEHSITAASLQDSINSLLPNSPSYISGLDLTLSAFLPHKAERKGRRHHFTWKFNHQGIASRFLLKLNKLRLNDSLLIFDKSGGLSEIITSGFPSYFSSEALADEQYVQLRSSETEEKFSFLKISAEPLSLQKNKTNGFGDSQPCQINVNCFNTIDDIESSVVRILIRKGNLMGFCTGTLMNNSNYDFKPYILTAEHCGIISGDFVEQQDLDGWVFYFNYQSQNCDNPPSEGILALQKLVGSEVLARSYDRGGETGSDFLLLKLNENIPSSYNAFYAGWNRSGVEIPREGYTIHHPEGDIKKISVYHYPPEEGSFGENINYDTHWLVNWSSSPYGFGTTESGSSGAALLDQELLVRGQLTGGRSSCASPLGEDYFGMLSFSWNLNKPADNSLAAWLDPLSKGYLAIGGLYNGETPLRIDSIEIFPSPASDFIILGKLNPFKELRLTISHISGKVVFDHYIVTTEMGTEKVKIDNWASGIYIAYIYIDDIMHTYKFSIL